MHRQSAELPRKTLPASVPVSKDNTPRLDLHGSPDLSCLLACLLAGGVGSRTPISLALALSLSRPVSSHISCSPTFSTRDSGSGVSTTKPPAQADEARLHQLQGGSACTASALISSKSPSCCQAWSSDLWQRDYRPAGLVLHLLAVELRHRWTMGSDSVTGRHLTSHLQIHWLPPLWQG